MKSRYLRIAYVIIHGLLALYLVSITVTILVRQALPNLAYTQASTKNLSVPFLIPLILHILLSVTGIIPSLRLPDTSRNEIERNLSPLMYFFLSLMDIFILVPHMALTATGMASFSFIGKTHVFAMIFFLSLLLLMGLFHMGINTGKLVQFTLLAATGSLLIAALVPLSVALHPSDPSRWPTDRQFFLVPLILGLLGILTHVAIYIRERSQHNMFRSISFTCIVSGNLLYIARAGSITIWMGIFLLAIGITMGIPRDRFSQLQ